MSLAVPLVQSGAKDEAHGHADAQGRDDSQRSGDGPSGAAHRIAMS